MKVLLVNEASGVNGNLKRGLESLGCEVILAMPGESTPQNRKADFFFGNPGTSLIAKAQRNILPLWKLSKFTHFDVAHFILGISAFSGRLLKYRDLQLLKAGGVTLSYYGLGCDEASLFRVRKDVDSLPCSGCLAYDELGKTCDREILGWRERAMQFAGQFDHCVSAIFEYDHCHDFFPKARHANIPFPIDLSAIKYYPAKPKSKPLIIHSPTRRGFKGTAVIVEAIERLKERTSHFDFQIIEGLPYADYLEAVQSADIMIDQVFTQSPGIAALENLAMGKIVFSGNGPDGQAYFPFGAKSPIIDAAPDPARLADSLFEVLKAQHEFPLRAEAGRAFVAQHHDHVAVARAFLDLWQGARSCA